MKKILIFESVYIYIYIYIYIEGVYTEDPRMMTW